MFRARWLLLVAFLATACAGSTAIDDEASWSAGGGAGAVSNGGQGTLDAGSWPTGGSAGADDGSGSAGAGGGSAGAGGAASGKPYYLHDGRTYDQESDYVERDGQVSFVTLKHKDQTSLPPNEGGASCSGGCDEQVTRIEAGASIWGRFQGFTGINIQLATTDEAGVGQGVFSVCNSDLPAFDVAAASTGLPGFNNMPSPAYAVSPSDDCEWRVKAVGGFVYFRAITVSAPAGGGGSGGGPS